MAVIIDSYSETNITAAGALNITGAALGQSFTGMSGILNSAAFHIRKQGSPINNVYVQIYDHAGTYGTSSIPGSTLLATSDAIDASTLTTSFQVVTFTFSGANKIPIQSEVKYCAVITYDGDSTNYVGAGFDDTSPAHSGNKFYYFGGWNAQSTMDMCFYVYADNSAKSPFPSHFRV